MPKNKDIEKRTQSEWKFARQLNQARRKIDLDSPAGKALDKALLPLYKKYGYYSNANASTDMNLSHVSDKEVALFHGNVEAIMNAIGIDLNYYHNTKDLPFDTEHALRTAYVRASEALRDVKKKLTFEKYTSGNTAWEIYGILHWVTSFADMLQKIKNEQQESVKENKKQITEDLQKLIYHAPKKTDQHIDAIAKNYNTHRFYVIESFKDTIGLIPADYTEILVNEGLGDYIKYRGSQLGHKVMSKVGKGQAKVIAKAKHKAGVDMNTILTKWNQISLGDPKAATPEALMNFLTNNVPNETTVKASPEVVAAVLKKYRKKLIKESKQRVSLQEKYLPKSQLRSFFLDVINAQRAAALNPPKTKTKAAPPVATAPQVAPAPVQSKPNNSTQAAVSTPGQVNTQPVAPVKPAGGAEADIKAALDSLPANKRAQAILQALPSLSDDQIKQILNGLVTRKS